MKNNIYYQSVKNITPASADVKSGGKFAIANFVTLFTVSWKQWLC
jgi:hypothetical protein